MNNLSTLLYRNYAGHYNGWGNFNLAAPNKSLFMIVPINEDTFEIPTFLLNKFINIVNIDYENNVDAIVVDLNYLYQRSGYKSIDSCIRKVVSTSFEKARLIKIADVGDHFKSYYGTQGAIFNSDFSPLMMMSWIMKKVPKEDDSSSFEYKFYKPILRVSPEVFINKDDSVQRYIINKVVSGVLNIDCIACPHIYSSDRFNIDSMCHSFKAKVEIEHCPFVFKKTDIPSISTTDEELLNTVINNIDEVIQ